MKSSSFSLPQAIIFDWDNTLVDSWGAIGDAINTTRAHFGMPAWTPAEIMANCIRSARESFPDWFGDRWQEAKDIFYERFRNVRLQNFAPKPGAETLLKWLEKQNIPCVVVSNKNGAELRLEADTLKWNDYFVSVVGAGDAKRDKPARDHADHALTLAGLKGGEHIWFVGDSSADIMCARNAGCTSVLIGTPTLAAELKVDIHFETLSDLGSMLIRLSQPNA